MARHAWKLKQLLGKAPENVSCKLAYYCVRHAQGRNNRETLQTSGLFATMVRYFGRVLLR